MNYWLVKSEPTAYSYDDLVKDGSTCWSGVRNYAARIHLKGMKKGDHVLFYHSNEGTAVVGISKVVKEFYQDPTTKEDAWVAVDLAPHKKLKRAVTLAEIKAEKKLKDIPLVRIGRLSVMPLEKDAFEMIVGMGSK